MSAAGNVSDWALAARTETPAVSQLYSPVDNPRMSAQQSVLTMSGSLCIPQDVAIEGMLDAEHRWRIVVKAELKTELLRQSTQ